MKRILFIHSSSELYGSDRSLLNIVKYINKKKYKIFVLLPTDGALKNEIKKIPEVRVDIFELAVLRRKNLSPKGAIRYIRDFVVSYQFLKRYVREYEIDIVDTNTSVIFVGAIVAKRNGLRSIWHVREIIKSNFENRVISSIIQRYADCVIVNSKATGENLKANKNKIEVVYNAVEEQKQSPRKQHEALTVGMAGRINRWKGQSLFVDVAERVKREFPEVIFKIAGETYIGEENIKQELIDYIKEKGLSQTVQLLGQVDDMLAFYSSIDVLVLPSIQPEPFGLVLIEAMECGVPVIATNHGGPMEIIEDGVSGYLVDYSEATQMANRVIELLLDKEKRLSIGSEGKIRKRGLFSVCEMVKKMERIYDKINV